MNYDIKAQTHAVVDNVRRIVEEAGASMDQVVDVTTFLVDMKRDFAGYNEVWQRHSAKLARQEPPWPLTLYPRPLQWK